MTKWLPAEKTVALVQKATGHADVRTTMGYEHLVNDDLRSLDDALAGDAGALVARRSS